MTAMMEYHCTKTTDTSMRIFERAMEKFPAEEELAVRYLGFLISINDDSSTLSFCTCGCCAKLTVFHR